MRFILTGLCLLITYWLLHSATSEKGPEYYVQQVTGQQAYCFNAGNVDYCRSGARCFKVVNGKTVIEGLSYCPDKSLNNGA